MVTSRFSGRQGLGGAPAKRSASAQPSVRPFGLMRQFAAATPGRAQAGDLLDLQRTVGNRSFSQLVHGAEEEAERTAARVVGGPYRAVEEGASQVTPEIRRSMQAASGGGQPLPLEMRRTMERELDTDLSGVRLHANEPAAELNDSLDSSAVTVGRNIYFQRGEYNRGTQEGQRLLAHELTHVGQQSALGGSAKKLQRSRIVTIGTDRVRVTSKEQEKTARAMIGLMKREYGISVDSPKGVKALLAEYPSVKRNVRVGVKTRVWSFVALRAVYNALANYAPILGGNRATSSRRGTPQEVTNVSYLENAIDEDEDTGVLDDTTLGEYFGDNTSFSLFKASETHSGDFPGDIPKQLEGTVTHELAHGLFKHRLPTWVKALGYWLDEDTASGSKAEAPPTEYGTENADEDMCESVMLYFNDRARLQNGNGTGAKRGTVGNPCPQRDRLIHKWVTGW